MMMQKLGNGYSLWNILNSNLTIGLADKIKIVIRSIIYRPRLLSSRYGTREWQVYARLLNLKTSQQLCNPTQAQTWKS